MAIRVAATLRLVDHAGTVGATAEELAARTQTSAPALGRLLDHLVTVGVFGYEAASGRYRPTSLGDQMSAESPDALTLLLLDIGSAGGRAELAFVELLSTITSGGPAYPRRYGRDFWADLAAEPALRTSFDAQMNCRFRVYADQIAARFDWSRFPEVLDVGGGNGTLLTAILRAHPGVRGRVLDLAPAADAATERFAATALGDRATAVAGSFFDPLPTGADAYLLSDILHDWDDELAADILAECARAAGPYGTVVVIEPIRGRGADTAIDLFMSMCFGGRERTVTELGALGAKCGLMLHSETPVADGRTALEFRSR
ncbi:methyltransferase [Nocardia nova]|uniref:Methyltransferase n=2 Tax=Nocardia nova TaxID=37330 RepID=A0A2S6AY48_9NOCA|nr:methyltransferase [Nocardia nova]PPJ40159.1 methyltransferase [Nocardia nova]